MTLSGMKAQCSVVGCDREVTGLQEFCYSHNAYRQRTGRVPTKPILDTVEKRFWAKVNKDDADHWLWTGATSSEGRYGAFSWNGRIHPAHVAAYEMFVAPVPVGLDIDHLCRVTLCVNPAHLEPVTHQENVLRGESLQAKNAAKTHCLRGHLFTPASTTYTKRGGRTCNQCLSYRNLVKAGRLLEAGEFLVKSLSDPALRWGDLPREPRMTHCKRGHLFSPETTSYRRGRRICNQCGSYGRLIRLGRHAEAEDFLAKSLLDPTFRVKGFPTRSKSAPSSGSAADTALTSHATASPDDTRPAVRVEAATTR